MAQVGTSEALVLKHAYPDFTSIVDDVVATTEAVETQLTDMVQATIRGRAAGAGTGPQQDLTPAQVETIMGITTTPSADGIPKADGGGLLDAAWLPATPCTDPTIFAARNAAGGTIPKGWPVHLVAWNAGGWFDVEIASATISAAKFPAVGLAAEPLTNAATGSVIMSGLLEDADTSLWNVKDVMYVGSGGSGLTATHPTGEHNVIQAVAQVGRKDAANGSLLVGGIIRVTDTPNLNTGHTFVSNGVGSAIQAVYPSLIAEWSPGDSRITFPAASFPSAGTRNTHDHLAFDQTTPETMYLSAVMPPTYGGENITVDVHVASVAAVGNVQFGGSWERWNAAGIDLDVDNFDTEQVFNPVVIPGTSGQLVVSTKTFTNAEADGVLANEPFRLAIRRTTGGSLAADAEVYRVVARY